MSNRLRERVRGQQDISSINDPGVEKEAGDLVHYLLVTSIVKARSSFEVFPALIAGAVLLAAPLRAEFVYVSNGFDQTVSGYSVGSDGNLTPVPGCRSPLAPIQAQWHFIQQAIFSM